MPEIKELKTDELISLYKVLNTTNNYSYVEVYYEMDFSNCFRCFYNLYSG